MTRQEIYNNSGEHIGYAEIRDGNGGDGSTGSSRNVLVEVGQNCGGFLLLLLFLSGIGMLISYAVSTSEQTSAVERLTKEKAYGSPCPACGSRHYVFSKQVKRSGLDKHGRQWDYVECTCSECGHAGEIYLRYGGEKLEKLQLSWFRR